MPDQQQLHMYSIAVIIVPFNLRVFEQQSTVVFTNGILINLDDRLDVGRGMSIWNTVQTLIYNIDISL